MEEKHIPKEKSENEMPIFGEVSANKLYLNNHITYCYAIPFKDQSFPLS
jgi:hypothetical protein